MQTVKITGDITMPFYPMRPLEGRSLSQKRFRESLMKEMLADAKEEQWVVQPKLSGDRACLAVFKKKVYIQNRYGDWYHHPVGNGHKFINPLIPDKTVFDGEVWEGEFHPFEVLAANGRSLLRATTAERVVLAYQLTRLIKQKWMFERPGKAWLLSGRENLPVWEGVILKKANAPYIVAGSASQQITSWLKRKWH